MKNSNGFTLIELMITIAIISIISAIAIPAYKGYIKEARYSAARANIDSLKLFLEDYRLDNDSYSAGASSYTDLAAITSAYSWDPRTDDSDFEYSLASVASDTYIITVKDSDGTAILNCDQNNSCNYY